MRLHQLQAATTALADTTSAEQVAAVIVGQGVEAVGARRGVLTLLDETGAHLKVVYGQGYPDEVLAEWHQVSLDTPIPLTAAILLDEPIWLESQQERDARFPLFTTLQTNSSESGAIIPLKVGDRCIGAVSFGFAGARCFSQMERVFLTTWVLQGAQALERVRLYEAAQREIALSEQARLRSIALSELGFRLSAARTPDEAARIIVDVALSLLGWDACCLALCRPGIEELTTVLSIDTLKGQRVDVTVRGTPIDPSSLMWMAVHEGAQLILRKPQDLLNLQTKPAPIYGATSLTPFGDEARRSASLLFVPIRHGDRIGGVLTVQSYRFDAYDEHDLNLLQSLADHCGGALERMQMARTLRASEHRYQVLAEHSGLGIWQVDPGGPTLYANPAMCAMLEVAGMEDLAGTRYHDFFTPEGLITLENQQVKQRAGLPASYEIEIVGWKGARRDVLVSSAALRNEEGAIDSLIGTFTDITERNRFLKMIQWQAHHDALTGLPNRELFHDRLTQQIAAARRQQSQFAVMFLDLDLFKNINDTLGHDVGDKLLKAVSTRFAHCIRAGDTIARMGGDEFTLLLHDVPGPDQAIRIAQKLQSMLAEPIRVNDSQLFVTASIGISLFPNDGQDAQTLLKHADVAMYRAKEQGRNGYQLYAETMNALALERLVVENSLRRAIDRDEFVLLYQPQVLMNGGPLIGVEALIRWNHLELGTVLPDRFIRAAEEMGLIGAIGDWVLWEACRQAAIWQARGLNFRISINLSGRQFRYTGLAGQVATALQSTGARASHLELELTESTLIANPDQAVQMLNELKGLGVRLAVDDFGTGYSSLSYLRRFPLDLLKIDRSFVLPLMEDRRNQAVVRAMIELAHALDMEVIAEGVETAEQHDCLLALGCDAVQGYLFSPPLTVAQLEPFLQAGFPAVSASPAT